MAEESVAEHEYRWQMATWSHLYQDVIRLEITMENAGLMKEIHAVGYIQRDLGFHKLRHFLMVVDGHLPQAFGTRSGGA